MSDCIFCAIVAGEIPSWTVYEDEHTKAFMDINPLTDGHVLVVPKAHAADMWEISAADAGRVMQTAQRVSAQIQRALSPAGLNLLQCTGKAGWQEVFHFHLHLIPRYPGDGVHIPWSPRKGDQTRIPALAEKIRAAAE